MNDSKAKKTSSQPIQPQPQVQVQSKQILSPQNPQKDLNGSRSCAKCKEDDMVSLENELVELRQKYIEAKFSRKIVERDEKCIQNKMDLLSNKEIETEKKCKAKTKNQKNFEDIKDDIKKQRDKLKELKKKNEESLKIKKDKVKEQKKQTKVILSEWRMKNAEKHKGAGTKKYAEKRNIEEAIQKEKAKLINKNKFLHDQVKMNLIQIENRKKQEEIEKKFRVKKELEERINEELNTRKELQDKIDSYNAKSVQIHERIKVMEKMNYEELAQMFNEENPNQDNFNQTSTNKKGLSRTPDHPTRVPHKVKSKRLFSPYATTTKKTSG